MEEHKLVDIASWRWRDLADAPRDGSIIAVRFQPWKIATSPPQVQFAQWIDLYGTGGKWCAPYNPDSEVYADAWLPINELPRALTPRQGETKCR